MPRLELGQKKQLEKWIGNGPKVFTLLYSFTRDSPNAATFHQMCNNKGSTVTVVYNTLGSIYGGFAETSWDSSGAYHAEPKAFLFQLSSSGKLSFDKFPSKTGTHGTYNNGNYGPTFGAGHDLYTFNGSLQLNGTQYTLNGGMNFGSTFDMKGLTNQQITNNIMTVSELEVYLVEDSNLEDCWRTTPEWNADFLQTLKQEVEAYSPPRDLKVKAANILLVGQVGAGKSSFFNTISSVFRGYVTGQACSGSAEQSITSKYRMYSIRHSASGKPLKFRLCDTRGLEESQGLDSQEIGCILDGHMSDGYMFNPSMPLSADMSGYNNNPTLSDRIHCVCFVIDGSTVSVLPSKMLEKIKNIKTKVYQKGIPQVALVTKIDKVCSHVEDKVSSVFQSRAIEELIDNVSLLLGFPRCHVLPMKNYEKEIDTGEDVNILALLSLRQMLRATEDFMFDCLDSVAALKLSEADE